MGRHVPSAWPPDHRHTLLAAVRSRSPDVTSLLLRGVGGRDLGGALRFPLLGKGYLLAEFLQLVVEDARRRIRTWGSGLGTRRTPRRCHPGLAPYASGRDPRGEWPCSELGGRQDAVNPRLRLPQAVKDELLAAGHRLHQDPSERDPEVKHRA